MEFDPNAANYPRPGYMGSPGQSGKPYKGPGIYFDFISDSFNMVKNNLGVYMVGALLSLVIFYAAQIPFSLMTNMIAYGNPIGLQRNDQINFSRIFMAVPISIILNIIPTTLLGIFNLGFSLCALEEADTGSTNINTIFAGFKNLGPAFTTILLVQILSSLAMCFCFFPFFIVAGLCSFAPIIAVKEGLGPVDAISKSFNLLKPYVWPMAGFYFVAGLVSGLGVCACGIGLLFTYPILYMGIGLHYREFRGSLNQGYAIQPNP